jgi:hypothetical protein
VALIDTASIALTATSPPASSATRSSVALTVDAT